MTKLFISGYPLDTGELELAQLVSFHGELVTIKIVRDKATRKPKGYAFLEMINREAAENVIAALNGTQLGDRALTIRIKEGEPVRPVVVYKKVERSNGLVKKKRPRL